jgi:hypothetical protein
MYTIPKNNNLKKMCFKTDVYYGELLKLFKSALGDLDIDVRMRDNCKDLQSNLFIQNLLGCTEQSDVQPSLIKI